MTPTDPLDVPLVTGLALLLLSGYLLRTLFVTLNLPGPVGVLLSGWLSVHFGLLQSDILHGRHHFQECAFFLVLLTAGFEISHNTPGLHDVVLGVLPCFSEFVGISVWAAYMEELSRIEACITGAVLCGLADGIVIPKMMEFRRNGDPSGLSRLVLTTAPLEASFVLTLFGILSGFAEQSKAPAAEPGLIFVANLVRLLATMALGAVLGKTTGWLLQMRDELKFRSFKFTGEIEETYLFILAVALATFGLGLPKDEGQPLVPISFAPGALFQPELLVIVFGCFMNKGRPEDERLTRVIGGVWVFGQIFLFSMIGSKMDPSVFAKSMRLAPMLVLGIMCRFLGVSLAMLLTTPWNSWAGLFSGKSRNKIFFLFLSSLPRASLQGALGCVPQSQRFFHSDRVAPNRVQVRSFIAQSSSLYIIVMSITGTVLLHHFGPSLLEDPTEPEQYSKVGVEEEGAVQHLRSARTKSVEFDVIEPSPQGRRPSNFSRTESHLGPVESMKTLLQSERDLFEAEGEDRPTTRQPFLRRKGTGTYSQAFLADPELQALETVAGMFRSKLGEDCVGEFSRQLYEKYGLPDNQLHIEHLQDLAKDNERLSDLPVGFYRTAGTAASCPEVTHGETLQGLFPTEF